MANVFSHAHLKLVATVGSSHGSRFKVFLHHWDYIFFVVKKVFEKL